MYFVLSEKFITPIKFSCFLFRNQSTELHLSEKILEPFPYPSCGNIYFRSLCCYLQL